MAAPGVLSRDVIWPVEHYQGVRTCLPPLMHRVEVMCRCLVQVLLHKPFLERCKEVIAAALAEACSSLQEPLSAALAAASQHEPEPAGQMPPDTWPAFSTAAADVRASVGGGMDRSGSAWSVGAPSRTCSFSVMDVGTLSGQTAGQKHVDQKGPAGECCCCCCHTHTHTQSMQKH